LIPAALYGFTAMTTSEIVLLRPDGVRGLRVLAALIVPVLLAGLAAAMAWHGAGMLGATLYQSLPDFWFDSDLKRVLTVLTDFDGHLKCSKTSRGFAAEPARFPHGPPIQQWRAAFPACAAE
jgi:hypothetical protein